MQNSTKNMYNYTPKINDIKDYIIDKMQLRLFLLEKITDEINGKTITCSRMEFCQLLYMNYLQKKYEWDQEKIERHKNSINDMDEYAKWLATVSWTKDKDMERLFNDAVIRGFYHEIMTILGFLDIASPAERLAAAKSNRRSSVRRSLDGSMEILPVQFQPSNWFRTLSPNFSPQDLTLGIEYLELEYQTKKNLLSSLEAELRVLLTRNIGNKDLAELEHTVEETKKRMLESEISYYQGFNQLQIDAIKMVVEIASKGDVLSLISDTVKIDELAKSLKSSNFGSLVGLTNVVKDVADSIGKLLQGTIDLYQDNAEYFTSYKKLVDLQLALASAKTSNYDEQIEILKERIRILSKEVSQLETVVMSGIVNKQNGDKDEHDKDKDGQNKVPENIVQEVKGNQDPSPAEGIDTFLPLARYNEDTEFMDLVFSCEEVRNLTKEGSAAITAGLSSNFSGFFTHGSSDLDASISNSSFMKKLLSSNFTIGMRAAKVTIDRGGWFDPGICDLTGSYFHLSGKIAAGAGLSASNIKDTSGKYPLESKYLLPAFPIAFLVVKDITMKASKLKCSMEEYKEFRKMTSSSSSSMFGIRMSGGFAAQSFMGLSEESESTYTFCMKIPGPQILGWFMELPRKDISDPYESLSQSDYFTTMIQELKEYSEQLKELGKGDEKNMVDVEVSTIKVPVI